MHQRKQRGQQMKMYRAAQRIKQRRALSKELKQQITKRRNQNVGGIK